MTAVEAFHFDITSMRPITNLLTCYLLSNWNPQNIPSFTTGMAAISGFITSVQLCQISLAYL